MSLTINGQSFTAYGENAFAGGANAPTAGQYFADRNYGNWPRVGAPIYKDEDIVLTGLYDGVGTVRKTLLGRTIAATLLIVGASENNIRTTISTLQTAFSQLARYTIALPNGASYDGCKLVSGMDDWEIVEHFQDSMVARVPCVFMQKSLTN